MDDDDAARPGDDVVLVGPPLGDDAHAVLRRRGGGGGGGERVELGALRAVREGRPIEGGGELVKLSRRGDSGRLFDVEVLAEIPRREGSGPAQVASAKYREGWELIFGESGSESESGGDAGGQLN